MARQPDGNEGNQAQTRSGLSPKSMVWRLGGLAVVDAVAVWFANALIGNEQTVFAIALLVVTAVINWIFITDRLYPIRWLTPGLLLMLLMVVCPLIFTVYVALTNYSDGHILSKDQVLAQLQGQYYQPKDAVTYTWTAYRNPT